MDGSGVAGNEISFRKKIFSMTTFHKFMAAVSATALTVALLAGCGASNTAAQSSASPAPSSSGSTGSASAQASSGSSSGTSSGAAGSVVYQNEQYGFTFTLPEEWNNYTIVTAQWDGSAVTNGSEQTVTTGPQLSIRDPRWTEAHKRQDIPIMIFTLDQWNDLQQDKFHIGAAPIGPSELGRNNKYVFALPARYNFAYDDGYEEVETILADNPLQTSQLS